MLLNEIKPHWSFTPTKHFSAADKEKFMKHYIASVQARCPETKFYDWFYTRLTHMFMHIAHYNRNGFYDVWCSTAQKRLTLLQWHSAYQPVGDPTYTWSDVEQAIHTWLQESGIVRAYQFEADAEQNQETIALVRAAFCNLSDDQILRLVQERINTPLPLLPSQSNVSPCNHSGASLIPAPSPQRSPSVPEQQALFML